MSAGAVFCQQEWAWRVPVQDLAGDDSLKWAWVWWHVINTNSPSCACGNTQSDHTDSLVCGREVYLCIYRRYCLNLECFWGCMEAWLMSLSLGRRTDVLEWEQHYFSKHCFTKCIYSSSISLFRPTFSSCIRANGEILATCHQTRWNFMFLICQTDELS